MKKLAIVVLFLLLCLSMTGCMGEKDQEMSNRVIVQGIGVDRTEDGGCRVTLQVFDLAQAGSSGAESKGNLTIVYQSDGKSVSDAIRNLTLVVGKKPLYSHNRIIVIGESIAREGLRSTLDFFIRDYATRASVPVAVAKDGDAADILRAEFGDSSIPAEEIARILEAGRLNAKTTKVRVLDLVNLMQDQEADAYLPAVSVREEAPEESDSIQVDGMAVFRGGSLAGYLDEERTRGFLWTIDQVRQGTLVIEDEKYGRVSLRILGSHTRIKAQVQGGHPHFIISIEATCDVNEVDKLELVEFNQQTIAQLSDGAQRQIVADVEQAVRDSVFILGSDPFRFGRHLMRNEPQYYRQVAADWQEVLPTVTAEVSAQMTIRRLGQESVQLFR